MDFSLYENLPSSDVEKYRKMSLSAAKAFQSKVDLVHWYDTYKTYEQKQTLEAYHEAKEMGYNTNTEKGVQELFDASLSES